MSERFGSLFAPCCILLLSVYGSLYVGLLPPVWVSILPLMPLILAGVAILLAWHFNKGRVFILVLLLLIPKLYGGSNQTASITAYLVVSCFCVALLAFVKERGFFNRFAVNRLLFVAMLVCWCYAVERHWVSFAFLDQSVFQLSLTWSDLLLWFGLVVSIMLMAIAWWLSNDAFHASGLISILSLIIISRFSVSGVQYDTLLSAQCLLWIWFLLMESYRMAYLDDMTRLPGRRALNEQLVGLSKHYAIAMVDVDHFKKFNDTYGHDMGDKVLKSVAQQLKLFSAPGRAFRYGGEEFTVVFRRAQVKDVEAVLESVRESIEEAQVEVFDPKKKKDVEVNVTASIGVAFASAGEVPTNVLKRADEALYQSKKKGRNRVSKSLPAKN
ncbi:GGDEF domain-containing protein [Marinomonas aquiplantarum]|uniref:diguanylate cyclase n=1 Tax=Marinomonas aquiplantarum TaxID=491951 RepID=A0A366CT00_9GAMM|nr:GGDEF domain-containing protein [Marinomonas aquiplantarum]RBO78482.1 diguanylate cyclase (GGDEF)-like protein [Marinomonas aquiplantarum]